MFSWEAGELITAWSICNYVDSIAEAGKAVYDILMYTNVWLMEQHGWVRAGESYASGGGVSKVLDIYKWYTPHLDFIAPDNYQSDLKGFEEVCAAYAREDNPFFMPETIGDPNMFRAIADYNCLGNFFFAAGGTGLAPRDRTPEATRRIIDREVPGLAEAMRAEGAQRNRYAWLSRAVAGLSGSTLIVNLPGSERGACESLECILVLLRHALEVAAGGQVHP